MSVEPGGLWQLLFQCVTFWGKLFHTCEAPREPFASMEWFFFNVERKRGWCAESDWLQNESNKVMVLIIPFCVNCTTQKTSMESWKGLKQMKHCGLCSLYSEIFLKFWGSNILIRTLHKTRRELVPRKAGLCFSEERSCPPCFIYHIHKISLCVFDLNLNFPLRFILHCVCERIFNNSSS